MNIKYNNDEILSLHNKGLTDKEIADIVGATPNQIAKKRKRLGLNPNKPRETYSLSNREMAVIIGTLLGDSCIRYVHNRCKYPMLNFSHSEKQLEYFLLKKNILINIMASYNSYNKKDYWHKGEYTVTYQYTGKNMACLIPIRDAFYKNNKKVIPVDFIRDKFTDESIYYWFMDDGCYDKSSNSYKISTNCFDKLNLKEFVDFLAENFNLYFSIKKDNELYLKHKSNRLFKNILEKYNTCDSMQYKIG